jgi:putative membrane protein
LRGLALAYLGVFVLAAISPHDRSDWLLENLLVAVAIPALAWGHRRLVLSNFSYLLIFAFLVLHAVGSHYTYSLTPAGFWVRDAFDLARNPYDRFVHLCFGLLLGYPVRELVRRRLHLHGLAGYAIPVVLLLATSALYEIVEYQVARIVDPDVGIAFLGTQGDEWDAQKDMAWACLGALLAMVGTALYRSRTGREPWGILALREPV